MSGNLGLSKNTLRTALKEKDTEKKKKKPYKRSADLMMGHYLGNSFQSKAIEIPKRGQRGKTE